MEGCAMGQVLHGSARTTAPVRRAIHHSQESLRVLARRHGINPKTVGKMNQPLKDATVRRCHDDSHGQLRAHLQLFLEAYNSARRLKTLRGLSPYEFICKRWTLEPERF